MLTEKQKIELKEWVESFEIDVETLPSSYYDRNIYGVEDHLAVGEWVYVDEEYHDAQKEDAIECLKSDGWDAYFDYEDDQNPDELTVEAIEYVDGL